MCIGKIHVIIVMQLATVFTLILLLLVLLFNLGLSSSIKLKNNDLKPLQLPENLQNNDTGDKTTAAQRLLKSLGIDFSILRAEEMEKSKVYKVWNKIPSYDTLTYNHWLGNKDESCKSELGPDGVLRVTSLGELACQTKCIKENESFTNSLNNKIQQLISFGHSKQNIAVVFEPSSNEHDYECVPKSNDDGFHCQCKTNAQVKVNENLQEMFNNYLNSANGDTRIFKQKDKKQRKSEHYQNGYAPKKKKPHFLLKLVGLLVVSSTFFRLVPFYIYWWIFLS